MIAIPFAARALARDVVLADDRVARIRPIRPDDGPAVKAFIESLSRETRYRRFMQAVNGLPPAWIARIVEVDYARTLSLVVEDADGRMIALAQYVAPAGARVADVAIVIDDAWHGIRLGRALFAALLMHATEHGIARLRADLLADNKPIRRLLDRFGFSTRRHPEERGLLVAERALGCPWSAGVQPVPT
jgi:acetyltransferase